MAVVVVTGGAGYIGSFACKALLEAGHQTITYDNLSAGHRELVQGELVVGDIRDGSRLAALLRERRAEAVMHFAALTSARDSVMQPAEFYDVNLRGFTALVDACRETGVRIFVLSSTAAVYGRPQCVPIDESHPFAPVSPYGHTKLACEWVLRDYAQAYGMRYAVLRYFNAAGSDRHGRLGEWHEPETHLIPLALRAAATDAPLTLFGDQHDTPDGTCVRDYIHVEDLARAHVLSLEHLLLEKDSIELNLGTGIGQSVRQVLASIERVVGRQVPVMVGSAKPGDPSQLVANAQRASDVLGFTCRWTDLDEIINSAWTFQRNLLERKARG